MKTKILLLVTLLLCSCATQDSSLLEQGVSRSLADSRKANFSDVEYRLHMEIPSAATSHIGGEVEILFNATRRSDIIVDYMGCEEGVKSVVVNGVAIEPHIKNQHIVIAKEYSQCGNNSVMIEFTSPSSSLNMRENFVYTLLVPDRARALFPLFDQPNIKARYTLALTIPKSWEGITNSAAVETQELDQYKRITYNQTEPISSYLFAFAVGEFTKEQRTRDGKPYHIYHIESDPARLSQLDDIFEELFHSLDYLEEYTAIDYPFSKYDMVLIPSFQYGGMEHIGATFYKASSMFLSPTPTINERINRAKLVAHETAHMWFGDLVTMAWFDDVWTKEVFANYFAAKIISPLFPQMDEQQALLSYFSSSYSEDRTPGGTAIKQELDNLQYAGLVYNNIIYYKSPLVLNMISEMLGEEPFRAAVSEVLKTYSYDSATWEQWVEIFDKHSSKDITSWAKSWMYEPGMATITIESDGLGAVVKQHDPLGRGLTWEQDIEFMVVAQDGEKELYSVNLDSAEKHVDLLHEAQYIIPNSNGMGYGYFKLDTPSFDYLLDSFTEMESAQQRQLALINLYENMINNPSELSVKFVESLIKIIPSERDAIIYSTLISYATSTYKHYIASMGFEEQQETIALALDTLLWSEYHNNESAGMRATAFNTLSDNMLTDHTIEQMYDIWSGRKSVEGISIDKDRYMSISYKLALKMPSRAEEITACQLSRLEDDLHSNGEYRFISRAVSSNVEQRRIFFNDLLDEKNRGVETWVQSALALLMDASHAERLEYIRPALEELEEIQRTGDIFFPQGWCRSLLSGVSDRAALEIVNDFISSNTSMQPGLKSKLLIASDHLFRVKDI